MSGFREPLILTIKEKMKGRFSELGPEARDRVLNMMGAFHIRDGTANESSPMGRIRITPGELNDLLAFALTSNSTTSLVSVVDVRTPANKTPLENLRDV